MTNQVDNLNAAVGLLNQAKGRFSQSLRELIETGNVSVIETTDYIVKPISGSGGTIDLVEASTDKKEGTSSFDKNRFPQNEAKIYDAIEVAVGKGDPADLGAVAFDQAAPAQLLNAHLIIEQNGNKLLEKKVSDFIAKGTATDPSEIYAELNMPVILRDVENFDIKLRFPTGSSVGAAATAADTESVKVAFRAMKTGRKI